MNTSGKTSTSNLLQRFAVKKEKKSVKIGDRAITYNRCSTEKQDSVEWQAKITAGFVKQNDWQLIRAFGAKESAKTDDRREFKEMLQFCKKNKISHIVFYSYDRFSRAGNLGLIDDLRNKGIKIHSSTQIVDDETTSGRMMQKIHLIMAQAENEDRRDKIIQGQKSKLRKGEWISFPTLGYEKRYVTGKKEHDHDKKQCFINEKGNLIKQLFLWIDREKISNTEASRRLEKMGLSLTSAEIKRILRNPFYCGYITSSLLDEGEIIRGKHEPLVSEEVFLRVNGILNEKYPGWNVLRENEEMPLKATVRCSKCDRYLTAYPQKSKYIYYKCPNNGCCVNINNKKLHALFEQELSRFTVNSSLLPAIKNQLEITYYSLHERDTSRVKPMKDELARLKNELDAMELNFAIKTLPEDLYHKHSSAHTAKIESIEQELGKLVQDTSNLDKFLENSVRLACNLLNTWQLMDYSGKVRLQKLVFPQGLQFMSEIPAVRTQIMNPIFYAISSLSTCLQEFNEKDETDKSKNLNLLYPMFASSNFFWDELTEINKQLIDFELDYPNNWVTSMTPQPQFGSEPAESVLFDNPKLYGGSGQDMNFYRLDSGTGSTSQRLFK